MDSHSSLHVVLRDGTRVEVRRIRPEDRERLAEGWDELSKESRYMRFQQVVKHLSDEQLRYFTEVDHQDHIAWVAIDEDQPDVPGAGVARFIRIADEPTIAEAAITVADEYQGRGLGTVLLGQLVADARSKGVETFRNYVLAENEAMLGVFRDLGADFATEPHGVVRVDLALPDDPDDLPGTPAGRTLRQVGQASRLALDPPLWIRDHDADAEDGVAPDRAAADEDADRVREGLRQREGGPLRDWLDDVLDDVS